MFEQMSEIAAAAIFATRIVEVAEEDLFSLVGWPRKWKNKHQSFKRTTLEITRELWVTT